MAPQFVDSLEITQCGGVLIEALKHLIPDEG
jgi:hypothetical protein